MIPTAQAARNATEQALEPERNTLIADCLAAISTLITEAATKGQYQIEAYIPNPIKREVQKQLAEAGYDMLHQPTRRELLPSEYRNFYTIRWD